MLPCSRLRLKAVHLLVCSLTACGLYLLHVRYGRPMVPREQTVNNPQPKLPAPLPGDSMGLRDKQSIKLPDLPLVIAAQEPVPIPDEDLVINKEAEVIEPGKATKVLLLTYMRGGSSLLGEMFNQNPDALYWFEPVDGFYSHIYGNFHGIQPLDIFYNQDETYREMPDLEVLTLTRGLQNMYSCNLDALPVDVLVNFLVLLIEHESFIPYRQCIKTARSLRDSAYLIPPNTCKATVRPYCPSAFEEEHHLQKCHNTLFPFHEQLRLGHNLTHWLDRLKDGQNETKDDSISDYIPRDVLRKYTSCMNQSHHASRPCISPLKNTCTSSKIRALKAIRLRLAIVESLIASVPDIKIVVQFRDPRGTISSRRRTGVISNIGHTVRNEGKLLCRRLERELDILTRLEQLYPRNVMHFTYEDMVAAPIETLEDIYEFIGEDIPQKVLNWFSENLNAQKDDGAFGTSRKNGTHTAFKWRTDLSSEDKNVTTMFCLTVLKRLGYEV